MSRWIKATAFAFLAVALCVQALPAQEVTGEIAGTIVDGSGEALPGVTVEAKGPLGTQIAVTDADGRYRFPRLRSGVYTLTSTLEGFAISEGRVDVNVGEIRTVNFEMTSASVTEEIVVVGENVGIDLGSSSTTTSISRERIEVIPRGRDFSDVAAQAAGASDESQAGGISIDGSSGAENRFVIDGIDTTSPQEGVNSVPMRAEFIEEVQVKSAGYAAEYGGSTGGVINAVTKSGGNDWTFGLLAQYEDRSWGGDQRRELNDSLTTDGAFVYSNNRKDDETRIDPGFFIGGPIVKDKLWFFGSYQPGIRDTKRTTNFAFSDTVRTFTQDFRVDYGTFNLTGNFGSKVLFKAGGSSSDFSTERALPPLDGRSTLEDPDDWLNGTDGERRIWSASIDYIPTSNFVVSGRFGHYETNTMDTGVSFPDVIHNFSTFSTPSGIAALPAAFRQDPGYFSETLVNAIDHDLYERDYQGVDGTFYFEGGGDHALKFGYQTEEIANDVLDGYNGNRILYYAGRPYTTQDGVSRSGTYGYFRLLRIGTQGAVTSDNEALFLQDSWQINPQWTLNVGVRAEHEKIPNYGSTGVTNPIEFDWDEKIAPRVGVAWDVLGDQKWKAYASYGKYFDVMKYEMPRGSFGGDKWVDYFYTWDNPDWTINRSAGCHTNSNTVAERPSCPGGTFIEALDRRFNSATVVGTPDSDVDPNLKPMEQDEYQIGVDHQLTNTIVVGARYIHKELVQVIEDVGFTAPGTELFVIANPGSPWLTDIAVEDFETVPYPEAVREYDGLELSFNKRFENNWALFASYTYSKLYGNYSGLASSDEDGRT
ncbi:MAG TPA: TonB-dependent receptor, partial [Acidimicrobiia bacterium]